MEAQIQLVGNEDRAPRRVAKHAADKSDVMVGRRLRQIRQSKGFSLDALASLIGVSFQQIQKYEQGTNRLSVSTLMRIADALQVSVHEFLDFDIAATRSCREALAFLDSDEAIDLMRAFARIPKGPRRRVLQDMITLFANE
ncbi:MAG TPA: helix-turn-helix transcriptional regulator [Phenylobacterium sp.]|nr:helix-turn-helix transcriptional regulator [Phenylobacterium sp.]